MDKAQSLDFSEYVAAFMRRRRLIGAVALPVIMAALALAVGLPDIYRSTALIEFADAEVSGQLDGPGRSERETYEEEYVSSLSDAVLSRENLRPILKDIKVTPEQARDPDAALEMIAANTEVTTVRSQVLDPGSGREREIISAFMVSFDSRDPEVAQKVDTWLANAFIAGSRALLRERALAAANFYSNEAERFRNTIANLESKLADFKRENYGRLPELTNSNMNTLDRIEGDLQNVQMEIRTLNQNRIFLIQKLQEAQSAGPDGNVLPQLEAEYSKKSAIYDENHPDLIALRRQIENARAGSAATGRTLAEQVAAQRAILATARQRYSDDHPDIKRILRNIQNLEARMARGEKAADPGAANPVVAQVQTQLSAVDNQLAGLQMRSAELRSRMMEFEGRVETTPLVEREYQNLTRDLELARKKYDELVSHRIDAELKAAAVASGRSDELKLVRPPALPTTPAEPKRLGILIIGLVLGLGLAFSAAVVVETLDQTVRGSRDILRSLRVMPLAAIPDIQDMVARRHAFRRGAAYVGSMTVGMIVLAIVIRVSA